MDIDYTYIQVVIPRVRWLRPLGYELDVDQASTTITTLLVEEIDKTTKHFGTHDVVRSRVVTYLKKTTVVKKKDKLVKKIKKKFGTDIGEIGIAEEADEISDDKEEDDNEGDEPEQESQKLTQGLGEDEEEGAEKEEAKETSIQTKTTKRKARAPLTPQSKPNKVAKPAPKKPTTRATARDIIQKEK